jgi:hypothetical protein
VAPLLAGKTVLEVEPSAADLARGLTIDGRPMPDVVLQLTPVSAAEMSSRAPCLMALLPPDGIAVLACLQAAPPAGLRAIALHHAHYIQRGVNGSLFTPGAFSTGRIAVMRDPPAAEPVHIYLFARQPLPPLETGLVEAAGAVGPPEASLLPPLAAEPSGRPAQASLVEDRAASLARRLLQQEDRLLALFGEVKRLEEADAQGGSGGAVSWFVPPKAQHGWRLARAKRDAPPSKDRYDCRVDDPVILAARAGEAFFASHGLGLAGGDPAGAVTALRSRANLLAAKPGRCRMSRSSFPSMGRLPIR